MDKNPRFIRTKAANIYKIVLDDNSGGNHFIVLDLLSEVQVQSENCDTIQFRMRTTKVTTSNDDKFIHKVKCKGNNADNEICCCHIQ